MSDPSADDVRRANMNTLAATHVIYVEAIRRLMGDEGLKAIGEVNRLHGLKLGKDGIEQGSLRKGDLRSIFDFFDGAHPFFGFELSIGTSTDKSFNLKVTYCPWIESFKTQDAGSDICEHVTKIDEGIGQVVDPDVSMSIPKCMMRGDDHCIYRWEKE
ncbi:MAG: L-2-amino-thiazoline-4-carboxylic acid hydrolase [Candidatus Thorarchaeota archaeon]|nr:L-2-amino-thiazoline-4-carboxylic acid hydrolase [Candidatus Thorarchaeota archaeon]